MTTHPASLSNKSTASNGSLSQIEQLQEFYAFLVQATGMVARADNVSKLYDDICRLGLQLDRRLLLATVGMFDGVSRKLLVVACNGPATSYIKDRAILADSDKPGGDGPIDRALRDGRSVVVNSIAKDVSMAQWHASARKAGIDSCAAVPLRRDGQACGVLMLYAGAPGIFSDSIADELDVLSQTLSYALDTASQRERSRRQTDRWLALLRLAQVDHYGGKKGEQDFLTRALDEARRLTGSTVGFFHLFSDNQESPSHASSGDPSCSLELLLQAADYPVSQNRIWTQSFPDRRGLISNDYHRAAETIPTTSIVPLHRIAVPVVDNDEVCAIAWIGGKVEPYDQDDLEFLQILASDAWRILRRRRAEEGLHDAQNQLLQSEKMASIGQLAAGVAHEINNPIGFVSSNLRTLGKYVEELSQFADLGANTEEGKRLAADIDLDFLRTDIPTLLDESKEGLQRVRNIVQDLKDFSRVGDLDWQLADLHHGIDSTLNIVANEIKYKCTVRKDYGSLPQIYCLPSQLNQVFMNLLVNAAQAIQTQGEIVIHTETVDSDWVLVRVSDNGSGISPEHISRLYDPFFTTKPVGKGTGLGLSLAWSIVSRHQGRIDVESTLGVGTTFSILLPIRPAIDHENEIQQPSLH